MIGAVAKQRGWVWEVGGFVLPTALGIGANVFGLVDVGIGWLVAGLALFAIAGTAIGAAADSWAKPARSRSYALIATASLLVFCAGVGAYHEWFDPAHQVTRSFEYLVVADFCLPPAAEPGGEPLNRVPGAVVGVVDLCPGSPVEVECQTLWEEANWVRLANETYWVPQGLVRPRNGETANLPQCE